MEHEVGYIIIAAIIVVCVAAFIVITVKWTRAVPKAGYRGIGFRYLEDAVTPWNGLKGVVDVMWKVLEDRYGTEARDYMKNVWIEVVPVDGLVRTPSVPTGYAPKQKDGAYIEKNGIVVMARANGSWRTERWLPVTKKYHVMVVRQIREPSWRGDLEVIEGPIQDAGASALFHEMAQHRVAQMLGRGANTLHAVPELDVLEQAMDEEYNKLRGG